MDRKNIMAIKDLIDELIGENGEFFPTKAQLDYNDDWVEMYYRMRSLSEAIRECGF